MTELPDEVSEAAEAAAMRMIRMRTLREQARAGGLWFETFLPAELADWLLQLIEDGVFTTPNEAVVAIFEEYRGSGPRIDLRKELPPGSGQIPPGTAVWR